MSTSLGGDQHVVDRALVDQAAQRQDRLQAGDGCWCRPVTVKLITKPLTSGSPARSWKPEANEDELVGVDGQVLVVDRQDRVGRIPAERRRRVVDVADLAEERTSECRDEGCHRLAEGHDLGHVCGAGEKHVAVGDRARDDERRHRVGLEREVVGRERDALDVDQAADRDVVDAVGGRREA